MRSRIYSSAAAALVVLGCAPASAQEESERVTNRDPDAERVAETPLRDLNVKKDGIPAALQAAVRDPYATEGLASCAALVSAVQELDRLLGPDFDVAEDKPKGVTAGKVAEGAVGSLIPFRGLIREVSGAASAERQLQLAILAGATRRGYLKGLGLQRGCSWPGRPATVTRAVAIRN